MKLKTLLLLFIVFNFIEPKTDECHNWFPEPISFKPSIPKENSTNITEIIDNFLLDRDFRESKKIVEDYVIGILNNGGSGGYNDIGRLVFRQLPSVRQLIIAIFCIIVSLLIVPFLWKLGLDEFFEILGVHLKIDQYRAGLAIIPIFSIIGLLLLTSHISTSAYSINKGMDQLETANDSSFMPIKERINKKLSKIPCIFNRDFQSRHKNTSVANRYMISTNKSILFDTYLNDVTPPDSRLKCPALDDSTYNSVQKLQKELRFEKLENELFVLRLEYQRIISAALNISIPIFGKTLGGIEDFVTNYHRNILLLPSKRIIDFYQSIISITVAITVLMATSLTILVMVGFEFKKKWSKKLAETSVPLTIFFTALCLLLFIALITRTSFIIMVHEQSQQNKFEIFRKAKPINTSENGFNYSINFGKILKRSIIEETTLFNLMTENENEIDDVIKAEKLFRSSQKYNQSIDNLSIIMANEYEKYVEESCKKCEDVGGKIMTDMGISGNCAYTEDILQKILLVQTEACKTADYLNKNPINKSKISSTAYTKWTRALFPKKNEAVVEKESVYDDRSPMQVYMVFENPSKKLRPTILEHILQMASLIGFIAPIFFLLSIYFICILPLLMGDEEVVKEKKIGSKSTSKSKSSSDEKSKTLSNEKIIV